MRRGISVERYQAASIGEQAQIVLAFEQQKDPPAQGNG